MPENSVSPRDPSESDEPAGMSEADQRAIDPNLSLAEPYTLGPDSLPQEGVPQGRVIPFHWQSTHIYPGTERDYWLYIPHQYTPEKPACVMVFQDGDLYLGADIAVQVVFDNLIHQRAMPVTIGLFINAGDTGPGMPIWGGTDNRSVEYDTMSDGYARFLVEEMLPQVEREYALVQGAAGRAICGISSGGICAFTVAWHRPDLFSKVVSHCGSFTNLRGGHNYPSLIRKSAVKPLRVFLQSGSNDLDVVFGNWPIANQDMAAALAYRNYDYQFIFGEGRHSLKHGGAIFPDTLRWLWRDYPVGP